MSASFCGVCAFAGFLVDYEGAATRLVGMYAHIEPFMPILFLAGLGFCSMWFSITLGEFIISRRPGVRLKATCLDEVSGCLDLVQDNIKSSGNINRYTLRKLRHLSNITLAKHKVDTPELSLDKKEFSLFWCLYLELLEDYVSQGDLKSARDALREASDRVFNPGTRPPKSNY